jgi:hypothetical protein
LALRSRLSRVRLPGLLIRYFLELPVGRDRVEEALESAPETWIPLLVRGASKRCDRLLAEVGFGQCLRVNKQVEIAVAEPRTLGETVYGPISWHDTGSAGMFPELEGDLELASLGRYRTQLAISVSYTPPFDGAGRVADRALLHRVAESTIKGFLDRVAERLLSAARADLEENAPSLG